jgi:hypothetical protein
MAVYYISLPSEQSAHLGEPTSLRYTAVAKPKEGHDDSTGADNIEGPLISTGAP